ncbi:ABC transporter permease [Leadbettera azotonutricia]|uniref:Inner-membrane translocator n=1 Tax=Leadbettera azotonutricia (strain ATCC BAA-888 / DSM 13862 / ZAS-9) TaxID=545695 RepID=F5Y6Z1_LEAAZ|nr:ABC transporter permease [Leadbettera azotonutricia]AEF82015.1 inner-membrane translocator [Leadbettera azotonutricia ZAS-9]
MLDILKILWNMLPSTLMIVAPILIAATGGMICERAGVVNIALEGLMSIGAMAAATTHVLLETSIGFSIPLAFFIAAVMGGLFALIHAFASITLRADQVISGTGINLLANGITVFFCQLLFRMDRTQNYHMGTKSGFGGAYPTAWLALIILVAAWFTLYRRPWGLRLRAAGEHPQALASAGVNVIKIRYIAVVISGVLAGIAGACIVLTQDIQFTVSTINGKGFIALAAVSFGRWLPLGILGSSFLFGASSALAVNIINIDALKSLPSEIFSMLPYVITLVTLVIFSGKDYAPRASGQPYDKGKS